MPIRNANWYSEQSTRRYPLADTATGTGDDGARLRDDILVDLHLSFPRSVGKYAYVGGITVTDNLVNVVILAATSPTAMSDFVPLGVVSLVKPVLRFVNYPITPMYRGVGGFIVFGNVEEPFVGRFSTPQQSLILPRCASPYDEMPVKSFSKGGRDVRLGGIVQLQGGSDITIAREIRTLDFVDRPAIVFRLASATPGRNVLSEYLGPCDQRPESRNCDREGIETINGVAPDCHGNIRIRFKHLTARPYGDCADEMDSLGGVTLEQSLGLEDVCVDTNKPGRFVGEDLCVDLESSSMSAGDDMMMFQAFAMPFVGEDEPAGSSLPLDDVMVNLPSLIHFMPDVAPPLVQIVGDYVLETSPDGTACLCQNSSRRNVAVLDDTVLAQRYGVRISTDLGIGRSGSAANGGLVLNYREPWQTGTGRDSYFIVVLDRLNGRLRLMRWNGVALADVHSVTVKDPIQYDHIYRLTAEVRGFNDQTSLRVSVAGVTQPDWRGVRFSTTTNRYLPAEGRFGLGSDRSVVRYYSVSLEPID
jgi:hypothetical protein